VIATLWPVDDAATALLMVRLYEELFEGESPAMALRRAQLWLRDLNVEDERHYLTAHPQLAAEFIRRRRARSEPGARGRRPGPGGTSNPYAHPVYWAGFLAIGA
jgi:CHAT domain-containing protein